MDEFDRSEIEMYGARSGGGGIYQVIEVYVYSSDSFSMVPSPDLESPIWSGNLLIILITAILTSVVIVFLIYLYSNK